MRIPSNSSNDRVPRPRTPFRALVSACLLGVRCRYDGSAKGSPALIRVASRAWLVPVCPEQLGGLSTPRPPALIRGGDGRDVLRGRARLENDLGEDVTEAFLRGAREALRIARACGAETALLKARSPSCGSSTRYCDRPGGGMGVTAALLKAEGIRIFDMEPGDPFPPRGLEDVPGHPFPKIADGMSTKRTGV